MSAKPLSSLGIVDKLLPKMCPSEDKKKGHDKYLDFDPAKQAKTDLMDIVPMNEGTATIA